MKMFFPATEETAPETAVPSDSAALQAEIGRVIKGKAETVRLSVVALLAGGLAGHGADRGEQGALFYKPSATQGEKVLDGAGTRESNPVGGGDAG